MNQNLPINQVIPDIRSALNEDNQLILSAPPGAGKTTQVPIALLDEEWLGERIIIMLEPRRLAARNAAARMAFLLNESVGETVGYQIKMDSVFSKKTKILVVTEGILTRKLQADPALENVALIIFDEFHERSLHADLSLALSLQSQELLRDDLKILIMSATLNTSALSILLPNALVIQSEGKRFDVESVFLNVNVKESDKMTLTSNVSAAVENALYSDEGDILVFLPGVKEIKSVQRSLETLLRKKALSGVDILPLYGALSKGEQDRAIAPSPKKSRKVVLATNIAETSLTIEGIRVVVDSGLQKVSTFHSSSGMNRLETTFISSDSAVQRLGRAGRLSEGKCYRLWHKHKPLVKHQKPEILTSDLTPMMLELAKWGVEDPSELTWLDIPPSQGVEHAKVLLKELLMLDSKGVMIKHGSDALALGVHPRLAHMMLKALHIGLGYEASLIAALLGEKDILGSAFRGASDIYLRLEVLHERNFNHPSVNRSAAMRVMEQADLLQKKLKVRKGSLHSEMTGVLLGFAYPERIAKRRGPKERRYLLSGAKGAMLDIEDELTGSKYLAVADLQAHERDARIYLAATLTLAQIENYFSELIFNETSLIWNREFKRVEARLKTFCLKLMLYEKQAVSVDADAVARKLIEGVRIEGLSVLPWTKESSALIKRVNFITAQKEHYPELLASVNLPDMNENALMKRLELWLMPYVEGISDLKGLQKLEMKQILLNEVSWEMQQHLDTLAPRYVRVPSGSNIAIDYTDVMTPILAVRLQELFGLEDTPSILNGQHKLLIHLLSPAYRPMQVTYDLKSFWHETYHDVKKELRGKYKKHYWPDDPLTAQATNKTKKRIKK